jgi:hypothetical protein
MLGIGIGIGLGGRAKPTQMSTPCIVDVGMGVMSAGTSSGSPIRKYMSSGVRRFSAKRRSPDGPVALDVPMDVPAALAEPYAEATGRVPALLLEGGGSTSAACVESSR